LRKDHRYYEIVQDTIMPDFDYRYFVIRDEAGRVCSVQPFFLLYQDLLEGCPAFVRGPIAWLRRMWPNFLKMKTLMLGCAAGEGQLDHGPERRTGDAALLAGRIRELAKTMGASLIVLKEFPDRYRGALAPFLEAGFTRIPSLPMAALDLRYADFDDFMKRGLSSRMRCDLRRKFRAGPDSITMTVMRDVSPIIDDVYPLYLQVYERSDRHFEKLTREYFCELGRRMPDKVRYFVWREEDRIVAFSLTMLHDDHICNEYLGLDYTRALDRHLYFVAFRDVASWAIANGFQRCLTTGLGYAPKLDLGFTLEPLDLYVRHSSDRLNWLFRRILPLLEPTRYEPILKRFPNYDALWGDGPGKNAR
jgi:predicted N-acyltransferase